VRFAFESLLSTDPDSYLLPAVFGTGKKVSSASFAANAFILLFYPLAGYLADTRYGRYKAVTRSLWLMFCSEVVLMACGILTVMYLFAFGGDSRLHDLFYLLLVISVPIMFGLISFRANVVQFGIDQLQDAPSEQSIFYIIWYIWTGFGGKALAKIPFIFAGNLCGELGFQLIHGIGALLIVLLVLLLGVSLSASDSNQGEWFFNDTAAPRNPYKLVYGVLKFAAKHKNPIRRSAFTYCEDELPSRLDLGKQKYGGPFTTEQVEDVKTLLGILGVLVSFGPVFSLDAAATALYRATVSLQYYGICANTNPESNYYIMAISRAGALIPVFIVVLIPLYLFLVRPIFYKCIPGALKRMGLGGIILTLSIVFHLLIDEFGHVPGTCFLHGHSLGVYSSRLVVNLVLFPNFLNAIAYALILSGSYEFICSQSPHAMKGLLIGTFFAIKGFFNLFGALLTFLPFTKWSPGSSFPTCGFLYYILNVAVGIAGLIVYTIVARRYQYRQRDEPDHVYRYAEEYYDRSEEGSLMLSQEQGNISPSQLIITADLA
jgi:peptide/histidine transporter 3/4